MFDVKHFVIFACIFLYSTDIVFGLYCYECESSRDPECINSFKQSKFIVKCGFNNTQIGDPMNHTIGVIDKQNWKCFKFEHATKPKVILRQCLECEKGHKEEIIAGHKATKDCCDSDFCNSSLKLSAGFFITVISLIITAKYWM